MDVTLVSSLKFNWLSARTEGGILKTKEGRMSGELVKFSETGHSALKPVTSSGGSFKTFRIFYFWVVVWKSSSEELCQVSLPCSQVDDSYHIVLWPVPWNSLCVPSWKCCGHLACRCATWSRLDSSGDRQIHQSECLSLCLCLPVARTRSPGWPWYWAHDRSFGPPWHQSLYSSPQALPAPFRF